MTEQELIGLAEGYFAAVDRQDLEATLAFIAPDCVFRIETAQLDHLGRDDGIKRMFETFFAKWDKIWHGNFRHVADTANGRIATQFDARNSNDDGYAVDKHNCNFFTVKDGKFHRISVYMSGENTLT